MAEVVRVNGDRPGSQDSFLAAHVAWLHFKENKTNLAIAEQLGISRFRVARLLEHAMNSGIVQVTISRPIDIDDTLSEAVRQKYSLAQALVLPAEGDLPESSDATWVRRGVAELAARYLADILTDGGKFGVSWGRTIDAVATAMGELPNFPKCDIVQLVGGLSTVEDALHASDVLRHFAGVARGKLYPLHAPLIVPDVKTAEGLRAEASIARTLGMVAELDAAVVGVGSWKPPTSHMIEVLREEDVRIALAAGAVADVCAIVLDEQGREIGGELSARTMRAASSDLKRVPNVVAVATGLQRVDALRVILPSGLVNVLVTDARTAQGLVQQ